MTTSLRQVLLISMTATHQIPTVWKRLCYNYNSKSLKILYKKHSLRNQKLWKEVLG